MSKKYAMAGDTRFLGLSTWFAEVSVSLVPADALEQGTAEISMVSGDASFRRYFRAILGNSSFILMDAPPEKERCDDFIRIAAAWRECGVNAPVVYAQDLEQGFLCLSDFGSEQIGHALTREDIGQAQHAKQLYSEAFSELIKIQQVRAEAIKLPVYDHALLWEEMELFREWFCTRLLKLSLDEGESRLLDDSFEFLAQQSLAQPQVCVHRDYHSRNLMRLSGDQLGVLDFQDAVYGPVNYDLVSLLKDCYLQWPSELVRKWALDYKQQAEQAGIISATDDEKFFREFELMGMQRHLKVVGIFSRLYLRDGKTDYLKDLPLAFHYLIEAAERYKELSDFYQWLTQRIQPEMETKVLPLARKYQ